MAARTHLTPRAAPRRARLLVVALGLVVAVAACAFQALQDLDSQIAQAGLEDVSTKVEAADGSVVVVSASAPRGQTTQEAQDEVADVVWTTFPHRFDRLRVTIDDESESWTYADLQRDLGDRPSSLDEGDDIGDELNRTTLVAVLGILIAGVVAVAVIALVLVLVLRATRRAAANRPPLQPWMPPGVGPPPGGWAPAPPPGGWAPASAPPGPPGTPTPPTEPAPSDAPPPTSPAPLSLAKDQTGTGPVPPLPPPPAPAPAPAGKRPKDPDARRLGRRPRSQPPDAAHTPPGWG